MLPIISEIIIDFLIDYCMLGTAWVFSITHTDSRDYFKFRADRAIHKWSDGSGLRYCLISAYMGTETADGQPSLELFYWMHKNKLSGIHRRHRGKTFLNEVAERLPTLNIDMRKFAAGGFISAYDAPWAALNLVTPENLITRVIEFNDLIKDSPFPPEPIAWVNNNVNITWKLRRLYLERYARYSIYEYDARFMIYAPMTGDFSGFRDISKEFTPMQLAIKCDTALYDDLASIHLASIFGDSIDDIIDKTESIDRIAWDDAINRIRKMYILHSHHMIAKNRIYNNITEFVKLLVGFGAITALFIEASAELDIENNIRAALC